MIKAELIEIVKSHKSNYERYAVEELAAEYGVTILRLPPYHCELNPIELVWAQTKGYVARNNKTFKIKDVKKLFEEGVKEVTPENWRQCINHTIKVEDKMCQLDHIIDECVDSFIINVTDSDSDSEYTDSESDSESQLL
ncbi:uncharacterized protein LOC113507498 [Trichoplusia ni]|uniref:Uncharacterized protein LOC113507498 n=1 Tax=Trichoplusia ni TaxID=7111 RepID=A0A7E5X0Z6_TRINI|nr:uncharacterized protein LOC113507498 [Trichoplusia ni]